ncbi:MAG: tetratricopeptide repeat protein, partial [Saprospiraceae bacterium]|nr:tetratricopeptide repeat protein [Saprospiraceae bacterium]
MRLAFFFGLMCAGFAPLFGQNAKAFEKAGDKALAETDYYAAFEHYRDAMQRNPDDIGLWYKYAEVARQFNAFEEAEKYYEKVHGSTEAAQHPFTPFWLGQVKKCLGKYSEAKALFEEFVSKSTSTDYYTDWAVNEISACDWAAQDLAPGAGPTVKIEHLDKKINTPFSEFGAIKYEESTYYSSLRFDNEKDTNLPPRKLSKVLISEKNGKGKLLPNGFNDEKKL